MLSLFWFSGVVSSQTQGNPRDQTLETAPLRADEAMTSGTPGVDYNLADDQGFRHGPWIRYYSDGSLYYSGWFEHGLPVGSWWYFNKEGFAEMHVVHRDNPLLSDVQVYFNEGRVAAEGTYMHPELALKKESIGANPEPPKKHETWTIYAADGSVITVLNYTEGEKDGPYNLYFPNGQLSQSGVYQLGEKDGEWVSWFESGQLQEKVNFDEGLLDGVRELYWQNGNIRLKEQYVDGKAEGAFQYFLENGLTELVQKHSDGKHLEGEDIYFNGTFIDWFGEDRPSYERTFRDTQLHGTFREWHDTGRYVLEPMADEQSRERTEKRVVKGHQIKREGEYVHGKLDGAVYHYDPSGNLTKTEHYNMGQLERTVNH